jgi:putative PIN family toxin of toxin-antitoxin system
MKVVLDTNVIVSALINPHGTPAVIINLLLNGTITLLYDNRILDEYRRVLYREKFGFTREMIEPLLEFIRFEGEFVPAEPVPGDFTDEDDRKFLEVAKSGGAHLLVTGNRQHFPGDSIICSPGELVSLFLK